ncbi:hypothetical protein PsW64_02929 [Pseudovibrio sp. W64]|nr:hypothetical protein PsW64_02929 [Pseudovibrio sp. W64]
MGSKRPKPEEIVIKPRQVKVFTGQGMPHIDAIRQIGVTERLCCVVSDLTLDKLILTETAKGNL